MFSSSSRLPKICLRRKRQRHAYIRPTIRHLTSSMTCCLRTRSWQPLPECFPQLNVYRKPPNWLSSGKGSHQTLYQKQKREGKEVERNQNVGNWGKREENGPRGLTYPGINVLTLVHGENLASSLIFWLLRQSILARATRQVGVVSSGCFSFLILPYTFAK